MRNIIKRDGTVRPYEPEKIITAMGKAFRETAAGTSREEMERLLRAVEKEMEHKDGRLGRGGHTGRCGTGADGKRPLRGSKAVYFVPAARNEQRAARRAMAQAAGVPHWTACWPRSKRISPARRMR